MNKKKKQQDKDDEIFKNLVQKKTATDKKM